MQQVGRQIYHEGRGGLLVREGGEEDPTELQEMSATTLFEGKELGALPLKDIYERLYEAVSDLGEQQEKAVIQGVQQAVAKIGNTVSGDGRKLSPELLMEAYEKVQMSFGPDGMPVGQTIVLHPSMMEAFAEAAEKLEHEPYRSQMAAITERKRREWRDREGSRKLVG